MQNICRIYLQYKEIFRIYAHIFFKYDNSVTRRRFEQTFHQGKYVNGKNPMKDVHYH